jgi:hypothetical protein
MLAFAEHHPVLVFGLLVAVSVLASVVRTFLGLLSGKSPRQHGRIVVQYVQKHGYELLNPVLARKLDASFLDMVKDPSLHDLARATSDITDIGRFDDGSDDWLAFRCVLGARPVTIFNFNRTPPLQGSGGPIPFRAAKIQVDGLPRFSLEPRSAATAVETVVGKLLHQPESTIELDPGQHPSFGSRYRLRGADRTAVVEFFTPERIRFIETEQLPGTFASNARYLVYYESTTMQTEADYDAFIGVVERIATRLL